MVLVPLYQWVYTEIMINWNWKNLGNQTKKKVKKTKKKRFHI